MKKLTIDEFMEAWSIDRAKIVFKDGKVFIGCATYVSDADSPDYIDEIEIFVEDGRLIGAPLSDVKEIVDLDK